MAVESTVGDPRAPRDPVLARLDPRAEPGLTPASTLRRVASEPVMFLSVLRILVMDVAHTKVGAGVRDHSRFRRAPIRRLWATSDAAMRLVFGDPEVARAAARQVYRFHDSVHGEVGEGHLGTGDDTYTAHDASLLLWVWATILDSLEDGFTRWVRPLSAEEADALYDDMCAWGRFFGIPAELFPADRQAFAAYLAGMLAGADLASTANSSTQVHDVLWFRHWVVPSAVVRPLRVLAIGTLDPGLADRLDLSLDARDQALFDRLAGVLTGWYPRLPAIRTRLPYVYLSLRTPTIGLAGRLRSVLPGRQAVRASGPARR